MGRGVNKMVREKQNRAGRVLAATLGWHPEEKVRNTQTPPAAAIPAPPPIATVN